MPCANVPELVGLCSAHQTRGSIDLVRLLDAELDLQQEQDIAGDRT